jgi:ribosomal protein S27AE
MSPEERNKIITKLQEVGAQLPCPRCGNLAFSLLDGYFVDPIQQSVVDIVIGTGPSVPSVVVACTKCGFLAQHALGSLGLLPPQNAA